MKLLQKLSVFLVIPLLLSCRGAAHGVVFDPQHPDACANLVFKGLSTPSVVVGDYECFDPKYQVVLKKAGYLTSDQAIANFTKQNGPSSTSPCAFTVQRDYEEFDSTHWYKGWNMSFSDGTYGILIVFFSKSNGLVTNMSVIVSQRCSTDPSMSGGGPPGKR